MKDMNAREPDNFDFDDAVDNYAAAVLLRDSQTGDKRTGPPCGSAVCYWSPGPGSRPCQEPPGRLR